MAYKKSSTKRANSGRFFFTANEELTTWIEKKAQDSGLEAPEFLRMQLFTAMKKEKTNV